MHPTHPQPADESTPLLDADLEATKRKTPLPRGQLAALCISRLTDPIAYSQLFPYINQMLWDLKVTNDVSKIGFYSGLVESIFAISQTLTSYPWAKTSDIVGRRPIILAGAMGLAVMTLMLGFCTSLTEIVLVRALAGFLAGNVAVYHAVLAEITDSSNSPAAYSLYAFTWPFGSTIGPLIGGSFSNLGTKYPEYWGYEFIISHPYFMPNLVCSVLVVIGLSLSYIYLQESLPSRRRGCRNNVNANAQPPRLGAIELLSIPMIRSLTLSGFTLAFIGTSYDVVLVLFCYTPIERGGLSFSASPRERMIELIGYTLALSGTILAMLQLFFMPTLLRTFRASTLYHTSMCCWPLTFFLIPFLNSIIRAGYDADTEATDTATNVILWTAITFILICSRIASLAFTTNILLIRDHSPSPSYLGACSGLIQVAMCVSRCFSPAFISSVFALSVGNDSLAGYPIWVVVMLLVCLVGCYFSQKMVAMEKEIEG
ncbi:major facilitator superfamily domain-containing protein [Mycena sanguinolenta]|nr:major facilitator superfamily domain-containing protein [Mycena sanguinolenta]